MTQTNTLKEYIFFSFFLVLSYSCGETVATQCAAYLDIQFSLFPIELDAQNYLTSAVLPGNRKSNALF